MCDYCDFSQKEHDWEIELYEGASYKYEGPKYYLELTYPADGIRRHPIKKVEVNYCPKCGRKLNEYNIRFEKCCVEQLPEIDR